MNGESSKEKGFSSYGRSLSEIDGTAPGLKVKMMQRSLTPVWVPPLGMTAEPPGWLGNRSTQKGERATPTEVLWQR